MSVKPVKVHYWNRCHSWKMLVQCGNPWTTAISWLVKNLMAQALRAACQLVVITTHHVSLATVTDILFFRHILLLPFQPSITLGWYVPEGFDADCLSSVLSHLTTIKTETASTDITSEVCLYWLIVVSLRVPENAKYEH